MIDEEQTDHDFTPNSFEFSFTETNVPAKSDLQQAPESLIRELKKFERTGDVWFITTPLETCTFFSFLANAVEMSVTENALVSPKMCFSRISTCTDSSIQTWVSFFNSYFWPTIHNLFLIPFVFFPKDNSRRTRSIHRSSVSIILVVSGKIVWTWTRIFHKTVSSALPVSSFILSLEPAWDLLRRLFE